MDSVRWKKKYNIFLLLFIFLFIFLWMPFFVSAVYPKEYCLNNYCLKRPDNYMFTRFLNDVEHQSSFCFYTLSCKSQYKIDGYLNTLIFNNISGSQFSFGIGKEDKRVIETEKIYIKSTSKCKYSEILIEEDGLNRVQGYFIVDDYVFHLFSDKPELLSNAITDLCSE